MAYSLFIARKYVGAGRRSGFITAITVISVGGVAVGVLALIVVLAVMNGFENEVIKRIVGTNAHVMIRKDDGIEDYRRVMERVAAMPHVEGVAPFVFSKAMVMSSDGTDAVFVKGIDLDAEGAVTDIGSYLRPQGFRFSRGAGGAAEIIVGKELAYSLRVAPGDTLLLARGEVSPSSAFGIIPSFKRVVVGALFDSGMYEYDASLAFLDLPEGQSFNGLGDRIGGVSVRLDDMYSAPLVSEGISTLLGNGYSVSDWIHMNRNLFVWMKTEKRVMFIILTLIIVVAAFNIAGTLIMIVMERTKDIGILRSMGATRGAVMRIFILHGLITGAIGTAIGAVGGVVLSLVVDRYKLIQLPGDIYFIDTVPVRLEAGDIVAVASVALLVCFVSTLYPAWQASRLVPVEAIRYE
ncbi:MAG: lipoprotein-releasing ABC transporter permease subunit [bacterium]